MPTPAVTPRSDRDNLAILDKLRPRYEKLREQKIRNESNIERAEIEVAEAKKEAENSFGTSNVEELRTKARDGYAKNTADVDAFADVINSVESEVAAINAEADQPVGKA